MTVKERLIAFLKSINISQKDFAGVNADQFPTSGFTALSFDNKFGHLSILYWPKLLPLIDCLITGFSLCGILLFKEHSI